MVRTATAMVGKKISGGVKCGGWIKQGFTPKGTKGNNNKVK